MLQKNEHHTFTGMQKDLAISKHPSKYLFDAENIRLTQRNDGSTLLAVTNEKGTKETSISIAGTYLGHCVLDKYLVVFSKGDKDYIERIDLSTLDKKELYSGDLSFNTEHPIECLGSYETEIIQKVYWTDGLNPPRVINIANTEVDGDSTYDYSNKTTPFDFVTEIDFPTSVTVTKKFDDGGMFPAGVIQYAFTYYNKYAQESNIFYTTELHSISFKKRGGNPEDKISNSFTIKIEGLSTENTFDYIRVYSILRTSEEGTPAVRRVVDIPYAATITFTDTGTIGDVVDPTVLLYIGGEDIIAQTITAKDGTMFLGNIKIKREEIGSAIKTALQGENISFSEISSNDAPVISAVDTSDFYTYYNNIDIPPFFKYGEHYRFGIQFQHKTGRWSAPVPLEDLTMNSSRPRVADNKLYFSVGSYTIPSSAVTSLSALGYVRARGVVVLPTLQDRLILTQGILCPTVFNTKMRTANAPYAMSSWFSRPDSPSEENYSNYTIKDVDGRTVNVTTKGVFTNFYQMGGLVGRSWQREIQCNTINDWKDERFFGVDRSIVTMHSPDIEFDPNFTDTSYTGWKMKIVGRTLVTRSASDIDIQTSTPPLESYYGFRKLSFINGETYNEDAARTLIAAPMWYDSVYDDEGKGEHLTATRLYMVYPWQAQGSLGNDMTRTDGSTQTSVLSKKKMSILKFCDNTQWGDYEHVYDSIGDIGLFASDQVTLSTLDETDGPTYFGNVDTLLNMDKFGIYVAKSSISDEIEALSTPLLNKEITAEKSEFVRMKYKSGRHMFFHLGTYKFASNTVNYTLPLVNNPDTLDTPAQYSVPWKNLINDTDTTYDIENMASISAVGNMVGSRIELKYYDMPIINNNIIIEVPTAQSVTTVEYRMYKMSRQSFSPTEITELASGEVLVTSETVDGETRYSAATIVESPSDANYKYRHYNDVTVYVVLNGTISIGYQGEYADTGTLNNIYYSRNTYNVSDATANYSYFWLAELYRNEEDVSNAFGGNTEDAYKSNIWLPAGDPVNLGSNDPVTYRYGDTYYQRYDCLKTYAFTNEDENSIVDIVSFPCESRINADGRYDRNRGKTSNLVMSPINFNLYNQVYSQKNDFFSYKILDEDFYKNSSFPNQVTWTKEKQVGGDTDLWTNITLASTYDMDGSKGVIQSLNTWKDTIFCFQDKGVSNILFNSRVQIPTSDGVPVEISNNYKVEGHRYLSDGIGCNNKWTIRKTPSAIYFIDTTGHELYSVGEGFTNISLNHSMSSWFRNNGAAINKVLYDDVYHDVYMITDTTALCYSELLGEFTSFMNYEGLNLLESYNGDSYSLKAGTYKDTLAGIDNTSKSLYKMFSGEYDYFFDSYKPWSITFISNGADAGAMDMDKIFSNIDYRMDFFDDADDYDCDNTFSSIRVWNEYQDTQEVALTKKSENAVNKYKTAKFYSHGNPQKKFKIWRIQIPRAKKLNDDDEYVATNDRIRNPWCKIKLTREASSDGLKAIMQDLNVQYYL